MREHLGAVTTARSSTIITPPQTHSQTHTTTQTQTPTGTKTP